MGLSIFYSLALPADLDFKNAEAKLAALAKTAESLAEKTPVKVSKIKILNTSGCAQSQASMDEDFDFARSVCTPPGRDRRSPLGEVPKLALYFRLTSRAEGGICLGIAKYQAGAQFQMIAEDGNTETPYDGRWYFYTFIDIFSPEETELLKALLLEAKYLGFETTYRNEADR